MMSTKVIETGKPIFLVTSDITQSMGKDDLKGDFTPFTNCSNHFNAVDKTN